MFKRRRNFNDNFTIHITELAGYVSKIHQTKKKGRFLWNNFLNALYSEQLWYTWSVYCSVTLVPITFPHLCSNINIHSLVLYFLLPLGNLLDSQWVDILHLSQAFLPKKQNILLFVYYATLSTPCSITWNVTVTNWEFRITGVRKIRDSLNTFHPRFL